MEGRPVFLKNKKKVCVDFTVFTGGNDEILTFAIDALVRVVHGRPPTPCQSCQTGRRRTVSCLDHGLDQGEDDRGRTRDELNT
jgi:hypothetical protein